MNKTLLVSSLSAAALLAGCRVYLPGESPRRTVFGSGTPSRAASAEVAPAPVSAPVASDDIIAPRPVAAPTHAPASTPAAAVAPASALPQTAGRDSFRNYMGGASSPSAAAPRPQPVAAPVAAVAPAPSGAADVAYRMYTVQAGDSAGKIANSNGMTLAEFAALNGLSDPNLLRVGQTVKIATGRSALAAGPAARPAQPAAAVPAGFVVVQEGDTLSGIASRNGTTVKALMEANGISDANSIRSGRQLRLPGAAAQTPVRPTAAEPAAAAQNAVHPIPTTTRPVAAIPTTTRPVATIPTTTRTPVRVTADEASAAPGGTVQAGEATYDVDAALSGGGLGSARQRRAQDAVQAAQDLVQNGASGAQDFARSASGQIGTLARQAAQQVDAASSPGTKEYVVQEEDDIYTIAMKFNAQPLKIRALNGGVQLDDLKPGTRILVPAGD